MPHRGARASGQPRLSQSWRLPGCFIHSGTNICDVGGGIRPVLAGLALAKAVAVAGHLKDVHLVGQAVERRAGQSFFLVGFGPFIEGQIAGDPLPYSRFVHVWMPPLVQWFFERRDRVRSCIGPLVAAIDTAAGRYGDARIRSRSTDRARWLQHKYCFL